MDLGSAARRAPKPACAALAARPEEPAYPTRRVSCGCPAWLGPGIAHFGDALNICAQGVSFPSLPFRPRACPGGESRRVCVLYVEH